MSTASLALRASNERLEDVLAPRTLRLRYSRVFLPEYFSTVVISLAISIPFLAFPINGGVPLVVNPHAPIGLATYVLAIYFFLHLTIEHRRRFGRVVVDWEPDVGVVVRTRSTSVRVDRLERCAAELGWFFGRRVRVLRLVDSQGHEIVVHDGLVEFAEFGRLLSSLVPRGIENRDADPRLESRVAEAWRQRHDIFPVTVEASIARAVLRFFFLIPVAFVDFAANLWLNLELATVGLGALTVYCASTTLVLAAIVNRYVSYYLLTSRRMNR